MPKYIIEVPTDHVVVSMPRKAYTVICETLECDAQSRAFDRELRQQIAWAQQTMFEHLSTDA